MKELITKIFAFFQKYKKRLVLLVILIFAVLLVMDYNSRMSGLYRITGQLNSIQTQEGEMALTVQYLRTEIAYVTSEAGVMDWARNEGMSQPGDIPVEPLSPADVTPTAPTVMATPLPTPDNWQVWVLLFFGN